MLPARMAAATLQAGRLMSLCILQPARAHPFGHLVLGNSVFGGGLCFKTGNPRQGGAGLQALPPPLPHMAAAAAASAAAMLFTLWKFTPAQAGG